MDRETMEPNRNTTMQSEKKPIKKRWGGTGQGIVLGIASTLLVGCLLVNGVCRATGTKLVLTNDEQAATAGDALLDVETVTKLKELMAYVNAYYYDETDEEQLHDGLYAGLLEGLGDKYSVYYNADEYKQTQIGVTGQYYGIGAGLTQDMDTMVVSVSKVYEGTPSDEAGLLAEDVILSVDETDAASMEVTELVKLIRGEEGTTVHLEVYRPSTGEYLSFDVERANVTLPSVASEMLEDGIGYIRIEGFESETAAQFETAVADLEAQGMQSVVIDLRYNGGGLVDAVVHNPTRATMNIPD